MSSLPSEHERMGSGPGAALEQFLVQITAERDQLARERDQLAHERDQYKSRAEWLHAQLERLRDEAKTPRERVDPRQVQLVFAPFLHALLGTEVPASEPKAESGASDDGGPKDGKKRKVTPHGRRLLPEHLPVETLVLEPSPLPDGSVQIGAEVRQSLAQGAELPDQPVASTL